MELYNLEKVSIFTDEKNKSLGFPDEVSIVCDQTVKSEFNNTTDEETEEETHCFSLFTQDKTPRFWCSNTKIKYSMTSGDPTKYILPSGCHYLSRSFLEFSLGGISVKEKYKDIYRIAFPHYCCFAIANSGDLTIGSSICSADSIDMILDHSYCREQVYEKERDKDAGNDRELTSWTSNIEKRMLIVNIGWFYSHDINNSLPVYKISNLTHEYSFMDNLEKLLRMQKYEDGEWKNIHPNLDMLNGIPSGNILKTPSMYGDFSYNTSMELSSIDNKDCIISAYIRCDQPEYTYGDKIVVSLDTSGYICIAIFVAAVNIEAESYNNYFNFTDNVNDCYKGKSPIKDIGILYNGDGKKAKVPLCDFSHSRSSNTSGKFNSKPRIPGIWASSFTHNGSGIGRSQGIIPEDVKASLRITMRDIKPGEEKKMYRIVVRMKVQKTMEFTENGHIIKL